MGDVRAMRDRGDIGVIPSRLRCYTGVIAMSYRSDICGSERECKKRGVAEPGGIGACSSDGIWCVCDADRVSTLGSRTSVIARSALNRNSTAW